MELPVMLYDESYRLQLRQVASPTSRLANCRVFGTIDIQVDDPPG